MRFHLSLSLSPSLFLSLSLSHIICIPLSTHAESIAFLSFVSSPQLTTETISRSMFIFSGRGRRVNDPTYAWCWMISMRVEREQVEKRRYSGMLSYWRRLIRSFSAQVVSAVTPVHKTLDCDRRVRELSSRVEFVRAINLIANGTCNCNSRSDMRRARACMCAWEVHVDAESEREKESLRYLYHCPATGESVLA